MSTQNRGMHAQEGGCLNIVPSTLYQHIFFRPRAQVAAVLYIVMSGKCQRRERKKRQSVMSLDGQPTMDDNDSKRLRRFSLKKYLFSRPSRDHLIARRGVSWFFLLAAARCGRTRRRRRGRVYSAPMSSLFYYRLWLRGFSFFSPQICRAIEGPAPCAEILAAAAAELIRFLWKKDVCVPGPTSSSGIIAGGCWNSWKYDRKFSARVLKFWLLLRLVSQNIKESCCEWQMILKIKFEERWEVYIYKKVKFATILLNHSSNC